MWSRNAPNPCDLPVWALSPIMILSSSTLWETHVMIFWKPIVFNDHRRKKKGLLTTQHYNPWFLRGYRTVGIWSLIRWKFQTLFARIWGNDWMLQPWNVPKHKNKPGSPWPPVFSPVGLRVSPFFSNGKGLLVGGWTNPFEKYACQNGNLRKIGLNITNIWNHHPVYHDTKRTAFFQIGSWLPWKTPPRFELFRRGEKHPWTLWTTFHQPKNCLKHAKHSLFHVFKKKCSCNKKSRPLETSWWSQPISKIYISQIGTFPQLGVKITKDWNWNHLERKCSVL